MRRVDHIALVKRFAIEVDGAVADGDHLARQGDHALDVDLPGVVRIAEDNHVAALRRVEPVAELIAQEALAGVEVRLHAASMHAETLQQEGLGEEEETACHYEGM